MKCAKLIKPVAHVRQKDPFEKFAMLFPTSTPKVEPYVARLERRIGSAQSASTHRKVMKPEHGRQVPWKLTAIPELLIVDDLKRVSLINQLSRNALLVLKQGKMLKKHNWAREKLMLYTCSSGLLCLAEHAIEETPTNIVVSFSIFRASVWDLHFACFP